MRQNPTATLQLILFVLVLFLIVEAAPKDFYRNPFAVISFGVKLFSVGIMSWCVADFIRLASSL